jgi:hypothetical protein
VFRRNYTKKKSNTKLVIILQKREKLVIITIVLRPGEPGHSPGLRPKFFAISYVNPIVLKLGSNRPVGPVEPGTGG